MILIIAYGNSLRQDDGAGLLLAEMLETELNKRTASVERLVYHQLVPELVTEISRDEVDTVIFVDTRMMAPYEIQPQVQIELITCPADASRLGHHLIPGTLLIYAEQLYRRHPPAWQVTIPGVAFGFSATLSDVAQSALDNVETVWSEWLGQVAVNRRCV